MKGHKRPGDSKDLCGGSLKVARTVAGSGGEFGKKGRTQDPALSNLIKSVKAKTQTLQQRKK